METDIRSDTQFANIFAAHLNHGIVILHKLQ